MRKQFLLFILSLISLIGGASTLNDAKALYLDGQFEKALPIFMNNYKRSPKNASLNHWIGVCLYKTGKFSESLKYLKFAKERKVIESPYYLALANFELGNYNSAIENIAAYEEIVESNNRSIPADFQKKIDNMRLANIMLDHVEKVEVIDSIIVDKDTFFNYFRISPEIGRFEGLSKLDDLKTNDPIAPVYVPQSGDKMFWADLNDNGHYSLYQTNKLFDDSWDTPSEIDSILPDSIDVITPFMLPDGTTFYFAANGPESIGGYDIFIASKDLESGKFYTPQNIGMPYNSPYDDYLYAVDEFTGAGWWATDRNQIPGKLTIYIFKPSSLRINYSIDDPNLRNLAKLTSIRDTWKSDSNYSELLNQIQSIDMDAKPVRFDFTFNVTNGKIYHHYSDFKSKNAKDLMHKYVNQTSLLQTKLDELSILRDAYKSEKKGTKYNSDILNIENEVLKLHNVISKLASEIRKAELNTNNK